MTEENKKAVEVGTVQKQKPQRDAKGRFISTGNSKKSKSNQDLDFPSSNVSPR